MSSLPVVVINVTITITKAAALNYTAHMHIIIYVVMGNTR